MNSSKLERDRAHDEGFAEIVTRTAGGKWVDFGPGVRMQLLRGRLRIEDALNIPAPPEGTSGRARRRGDRSCVAQA